MNSRQTTKMADLVDLLEARRMSFDALWLTFHDYSCSHYKQSLQRSPSRIRSDIYNEPLIQEILQKDSKAKEKIEKILTEMAHTFTLRSVRFIGYFVLKIMKSIYRHVWVDNQIVIPNTSIYYQASSVTIPATLNHLIAEAPILYLPTHRSYADFLLFSYICFQMKLPLPAIAAGIDFLSLNQIASLLRSCGAFFIRRSFKDSGDTIYRKVFRAYVQDLVRGGEMPLECFIEGTRSRTGKSLQPKLGLFGTALQLFWTSQIPDLILMPVSVCYDRILEEDLYAKELSPPQIDVSSGSKPKETPQHLLNGAKAILSQDFGSVYLRFGSPISLREIEGTQIIRSKYAKISKLAEGPQCKEEVTFADNLARQVIQAHHKASIISSFSLFSLVAFSDLIGHCNYLEYEPLDLTYADYPVDEIIGILEQLGDLVSPNNLSYKLFQKKLKEELLQSLAIHHNLVKLVDGSIIRIPLETHLTLARLRNYSNQFLQLVIGTAMVSFSSTYDIFLKLEAILSQEFVLIRMSQTDFETIKSTTSLSSKVADLFSAQINYFLFNYQRLTDWILLIESDELIEVRPFTRKAQSELKISLDVVQNFIQLCQKRAILRKSGKHLTIDKQAAQHLFNLIVSVGNKRDNQLPNLSQIKPKL